jgi:hypothetical protein
MITEDSERSVFLSLLKLFHFVFLPAVSIIEVTTSRTLFP